MSEGWFEGVKCNRKGCQGEIQTHPVENCSCHINPPCSACTEPANFCPECGWEESEEDIHNTSLNGFDVKVQAGTYVAWKPRPLDSTKIDYRIKSHTHFSQICEGVYPKGTTAAEIAKKCKGTFGGRFEHFGGGRFKYIAYTD